MTRGAALPFAVAGLGIAIFCVMDALMKGLGLALGAYSALLWRTMIGVALTGAIWAEHLRAGSVLTRAGFGNTNYIGVESAFRF